MSVCKWTMNCPNCDSTLGVRKSLRRGKSTLPEECPDCGEDIAKSNSPTRVEK